MRVCGDTVLAARLDRQRLVSAAWVAKVTNHTYVHENVKKFIDGFHHDAHPMGILVSTVAALSTFYPEVKAVSDPAASKNRWSG